MSQLGTAYVQIVPSAQGISGKIQKAINPEANAAGVSAGNKIAGGMKGKLSKISGGLFKAGTIATAVSVPIIAGIKKSMEAYQVQSGAETKLTEIYKTRMGVTKRAAKETMRLASAIQQEGVVGDEVTLSGAQQLATFAKYPKTVNTLLPAMGNLLTQQKGLNATSEDAVNIGNLMGKVMQGQTGALKRVGITFSESEEKVLKYGNEQERAAMLAKVITSNVGSMNKTMAKTPEGKIQQMKNSLGDMAEEVGRVLAPALANLAKWVSAKVIPKLEKFFQYMNEHPRIKKLALTLTGLAVAIGPVLIALSGIIKLMSGVGAIFKIVAGGPVVWIIAAIAALVAGFVYLWNKSKAFRNFFINMWNGIKKALVPIIKFIINLYRTAWRIIKAIWTNPAKFFRHVWSKIKGAFSHVGSFFREKFTAAASAIKSAFSSVGSFFSNLWNGIKSVASTVWNGIKNAILAPINAIKNGIQGIIDKLREFFSFNGKKVKLPNIKGKTPALKWYAKGGVFNSPSIIGVGEAGPEAVIPLDELKTMLNNAGGTASDRPITLKSIDGGRAVNITINNKIDGAEKPEEYAARLVRQLKVEMRTI